MTSMQEYKEQKETLAVESGRLTADNRRLAGALAAVESRFADMQAQRDVLAVSQEKATEARHAAEAKIQELQDNAASLQAQHDVATTLRDQYARELRDARDELAAQALQVEEFRRESQRLGRERDQAMAEAERMRTAGHAPSASGHPDPAVLQAECDRLAGELNGAIRRTAEKEAHAITHAAVQGGACRVSRALEEARKMHGSANAAHAGAAAGAAAGGAVRKDLSMSSELIA